MKNITFIGLGIMGSGMVTNLAKKGFALTLWDRNPEKSLDLPNAKRTAASPTPSNPPRSSGRAPAK